MIETKRVTKPLWVRIIFETPEFIYESLLIGMFPELRNSVIDFFTKVLVYCERKRESFMILEHIKSTTLILIEWINNNWMKKRSYQ